jgi:hypothetical protein
MDDFEKQKLKGELFGIRGMIVSSPNLASSLFQTTFPAVGGIVNIPGLASAAQAFKAQADCMEKLTIMIEKLIDKM